MINQQLSMVLNGDEAAPQLISLTSAGFVDYQIKK